jgi:hypothetical protein
LVQNYDLKWSISIHPFPFAGLRPIRQSLPASFVRPDQPFTQGDPLTRRAAALFVRCNRAAIFKIAYFLIAALLVVAAAQNRFSLPQDPLGDQDHGYLWPALMKLSGQDFPHIQGLNFIYPTLIYLILRTWGDFRAISVIQHILGLLAGGLFLATWSRLADFFPKPRLNRVAHEAMGLWGAAVYFLSNIPVLFEMEIRPDAICMFFEMLVLWLAVQFFYYRVISLNACKALIYGTATAVNAFLLASVKPSFALMALFTVAPVVWLVLSAKDNFTKKVAFFSVVLPIVAAVTLTEHHLRRNDQTVKTFLPETLFVVHAKIIHAQMVGDLKDGKTSVYPREWLRAACDDLETEIQDSHDLYPEKHPVLGFQPDYLRIGADPLLGRWRRELGDDELLRFLKYWYWHSVANRPVAFAEKVTGQLEVFYSTNCPAFSIYKNLPLASWAYAASFSALSDHQSRRLLSMVPAGADFLERTKKLRLTNIVIHEDNRVRMWNLWFARSYLVILLASVPLAGLLLLTRSSLDGLKWPAFVVIFLYSANFGSVFGISVVHTMEVWRYTVVQFGAALLAQLWGLRWLLELALTRLQNTKSSVELNEQRGISGPFARNVTS